MTKARKAKLAKLVAAGNQKPLKAPPACFFFRVCKAIAAVEKQGKAVCRACADKLAGREYELRKPTGTPIYPNAHRMAAELDMLGGRRL